MSAITKLLRRKGEPSSTGTISPSERAEKKKFERSLLEEQLAKMERSFARIETETEDEHGHKKTIQRPASLSHRLAKDIMLSMAPSLGAGKKAPLIKQNLFGLQDLALYANLTELDCGSADEATKGMNMLLDNTTLSLFPRSLTHDVKDVNIVEKEDPELRLLMKHFLGRELGMNIATSLDRGGEGEQ